MKKEIINKQTLQYLAELSRIEIGEEKEEKLLNDLKKILEYFEELKIIDVSNIKPIAGGADLVNIYRQDKEISDDFFKKQEKLIKAFPEQEGDFLKVPAIFK